MEGVVLNDSQARVVEFEDKCTKFLEMLCVTASYQYSFGQYSKCLHGSLSDVSGSRRLEAESMLVLMSAKYFGFVFKQP